MFVTLHICSSLTVSTFSFSLGEKVRMRVHLPLGFGFSAFDVVDVSIPLTLTLVLSLRERKFPAKPESWSTVSLIITSGGKSVALLWSGSVFRFSPLLGGQARTLCGLVHGGCRRPHRMDATVMRDGEAEEEHQEHERDGSLLFRREHEDLARRRLPRSTASHPVRRLT
jgi:hypothetical protein